MENKKVSRLNTLFEKMVSNTANGIEKRELNYLYQEYIEDGREGSRKSRSRNQLKKIALN